MAEDRVHRAAPDAPPAALARWARAAIGVGTDPPLRRPPSPHIEPIRRPWIGAFWQARIAVRAGITLDQFLRSRLARYLAALPVPRVRLPLDVEIDDGRIAVRPVAEAAPAAPAATDSWLTPLVALEGPAVRQEVNELEVRLVMLEGQIDVARRRTEDLGRRLAADVAAGIVTGPPEVNATAEQLGRPPVRNGAPRTLALGFAAAALAAEAWQVAHPLLRSAGMDPAMLGAEVARRPAELGLALVFALGVAAGLFALVHAGLGAALALFQGDDLDVRRRRWLAAGALGAGGLAALVTAAVAVLPGATGSQPPIAALVLLLLAVPLASALVMRGARRCEEQRGVELAAALAWDRERARAIAERERRLEELAWAQEEERGLERQREAARRRLKELNARAIAAARIASEAERRERTALSCLAHSLVGALELDRYEFVRQASARGAHELVAPGRRKAPEARSGLDGPPAPVAAHTAPAGRLAS